MRLCKLCGKLITLDASFEIVSQHGYGVTLVVEKAVDRSTDRAHLLVSEKRTQLLLRRQSPIGPQKEEQDEKNL